MPPNSSIDLARGELGRSSLKCQIYKRVINYWFKLLSSDPATFLYQSYEAQYNLAENNKDCWALKVKKLLFSTGYGEVWYQQGVGNTNAFIFDFKMRLNDMDRQDWHDHVTKYGTLRTYRNFKNELKFEDYLDLKLPGPVIIFFTKLRGGLLHVEVNEGRWAKPPVEYAKRICRMCNSRQIEDEAHLLFYCPVWTVYRQQLSIYLPFVDKSFPGVCSSTDVDFIQDVVKYLQIVLAEKAEMLSIL